MKKVIIIVLIFMGFITILYNNNKADKRCVYEEGENRLSKPAASEAEPQEISIYIDLNATLLYLIQDGQVAKKYPVAIGKSHTPSPMGIWKIVYKAKHWGSGFGTRWMGLNVPWGRYGIHGTNKPGSIGHAASHGCFRMNNRDVEELYDMVPAGAMVVVSGGPYGHLGSYLRELIPGDRGSHVLEVQRRLNILGYYKGPLDGHFGEGTKAALINYKKENGLPVNHYVDYQTYKSLGIILFE